MTWARSVPQRIWHLTSPERRHAAWLRCLRSPGRARPPARTSGTGWPAPPTAGWLPCTPYPEPVTALAGTRRVVDTRIN
jgi:hypothetical protein